jgi:hypothetical protein
VANKSDPTDERLTAMRLPRYAIQMLVLAVIATAAIGIMVLLARAGTITLPRPIERLIGTAQPVMPGPVVPAAETPGSQGVGIASPLSDQPATPEPAPVDHRLTLQPLPALLSPPPHLRDRSLIVLPSISQAKAAEAIAATWPDSNWETIATPHFAQEPLALISAPLLPLPVEQATTRGAWEVQLPSIDARHEASVHGESPTDLRAILGNSDLRTRDQIDLYAADLSIPILQGDGLASGFALSVLAGLRVASLDPSRESSQPQGGYLPLLGPGASYRWSRTSQTSIAILADVNQSLSQVPEWRVMHTWRLSPSTTLSIGYIHIDASFDTSPASLTLKRDAATFLLSLEF